MGINPAKWNPSITIPYHPEWEETFDRKLMRIKLGLIENREIPIKKKKIEVGTDTRNDYSGWNCEVNTNFS